jgi:hypothetical protein
MNIPDHNSESSETIFWVILLEFFDADADPGSGNLFDPGFRIRDEKNSDPGSGMNIPDPQHCPGPRQRFPKLYGFVPLKFALLQH